MTSHRRGKEQGTPGRLPSHLISRSLRQKEGATQIHLHHFIKGLRRIREKVTKERDARIGNDKIKLTKLGDGSLDQFLYNG